MMATLQNKEEYGKGPKKTFAPPVQKLHRLMPLSPNSLKEDTREISSPEAEATASLPKARLEKKNEKAHTENGPGSGQEERGKNLCNKQAEGKVEKERTSLTNAEFEEIVQIVLQKSLQECLETSCVRPIGYTQSGKERGIASITAASDSADGVPHTPEISASQENGVVPQINTSKPSQPDPGASEKKFSRLSLNKRKKEVQHGRWETFQSGHQRRQKDQLKKTDQDHSQIREQQQDQFVVWVQCSSPNCEKWRRLHGNIDPSTLPDNWSCAQNIDLEHNRCDIPEETWTGHESDVVYASYVPGSIIWAKQYGYPWWPGMVESDPDLGEYFLFASHLDSLPSKYHVTYFGDAVSRAWIPVSMLRNFQELSLEQAGVKKYKNKDCIQKLEAALKMAQEAEQVNIQERVNLFGFHSRYNRFESPGEGKDLMLSGPNSSNSRFEKEEEVESEMEEEEEKKDPTLPVPKPPRIQTKKPKPRGGDTGLADGQDGALQKKTKRSLGDESPAPPVLLKERKEGRRDSDPHQPGPKRKFKAPQSKSLVTSSSKERVGGMVPKGLAPPAPTGACPMMEIEGPGPREPLCWEAGGAAPEDEASSDLDLEQLLEDVGEEPEPREESLRRDAGEDVTMALLEE